ncbi:MAG TPA: IS1182 family transposase [Paraburkholderia sp.]|uniref:IS1182 family transposase n=1 Tax=Paraburkholderia sp. TaxID=1926495 RepID=UPI002B46EA2B|nr:IS1182 family transposase [Paraburkholderia sp.]HKR47490.1 IS1182 family transposase [Paraburkholderia sp.]
MAYIKGEARAQQTMFPLTLDELISVDHVCRVIEAFVNKLDVAGLGFLRAEPADTGRPGYDPRDLLKLYLYGYLQQVRSSRRLEAECRRNVEVMWLMGRLIPDYKSIAEFRRVHREAVTAAGAELVRLARQVGLVKGEWVAIDGSKFRAVSSADRVGEREAVKRYLEQLESADQQDEVSIDDTAVAAAMEKLKNDPEPEARFMRMAQNAHAPAYNVQTAVDATHGIIVAQQVTTEANDNRSLLPMARAAKEALGAPESLNVIADAGYSNGEQAAQCETHGIVPHVPANRTANNKGDGTLFDRTLFVYDEKTDTFRCPANQTLHRKQMLSRKKSVIYAAEEKTCSQCPLKSQCTSTTRRFVQRHIHDAALQRMDARATAQAMRLRQCTVERPFALLKWVIFGHPRFLLRGVSGAQVEISLATMAYNLKTMMHVVGGSKLNNILTA